MAQVVIPGFRKIETSSGQGTSNYNELTNKPSINGKPLVGNMLIDEFIKVDEELDYESSNPVANHAVSSRINQMNDEIAIKYEGREDSQVVVDTTSIPFTHDTDNNWLKSSKNAITLSKNYPEGHDLIVTIDDIAYETQSHAFEKCVGSGNSTKFWEWQAIGNAHLLDSGLANFDAQDNNLPFLIEQDYEENSGEVHIYLFGNKGVDISNLTHSIKIEKANRIYNYDNVRILDLLNKEFINGQSIKGGSGKNSLMCNSPVFASGECSFAEGAATSSSGIGSHSEGYATSASANGSHSEGIYTQASATGAHSEGYSTQALSSASHVEGYLCKTDTKIAAHAEGISTTASGQAAHAECSYTTASGQSSHAEGLNTIASSNNQHVQGRYNVADADGKYAHIVGGGTASDGRKNIHTIDWDGNADYSGDVTATKEDGSKVSLLELDDKVPYLAYGTLQLVYSDANTLKGSVSLDKDIKSATVSLVIKSDSAYKNVNILALNVESKALTVQALGMNFQESDTATVSYIAVE